MPKVEVEPILDDDPNRFVMFPIKDQQVWSMYKKAVDCFWRPEEMDLTKDKDDYLLLSSEEKHFLKKILAFFAS